MADSSSSITLRNSPETVLAWEKVRAYVELAKLRLNGMVLLTTLAGYLLAAGTLEQSGGIVALLAGVGLAAIGSAALNQYLERGPDGLMNRTADRPLPSGRLSEHQVLAFGVVCVSVGVLQLALFVNLLASALCAATVCCYLFCYTPLKTKSSLSTLVGAIAGALPPLVGWAAARGEITAGGWALFAILLVWQLPHFDAIAWIHRDDYRRAGMPLLPVRDPSGRTTAQHMVASAFVLMLVSLLPAVLHLTALVYTQVVLLMGIVFLALTLRFWQKPTEDRARRVMLASLIYLPGILSLWLIHRT